MAKTRRRSRPKTNPETRRLPSPPQPLRDQEAVAGILVQIKKTDLLLSVEL